MPARRPRHHHGVLLVCQGRRVRHLITELWRSRASSTRSSLETVNVSTGGHVCQLPAVSDWAKKNHIAPSRLMIPLSYATILGGLCSLIGTSTNLIVNGLLISQAGHPGLGLFDITWVGLPCALVGLLYLLAVGRWLLPDRQSAMSELSDPRLIATNDPAETFRPVPPEIAQR